MVYLTDFPAFGGSVSAGNQNAAKMVTRETITIKPNLNATIQQWLGGTI